jgi:hypothetical protein
MQRMHWFPKHNKLQKLDFVNKKKETGDEDQNRE